MGGGQLEDELEVVGGEVVEGLTEVGGGGDLVGAHLSYASSRVSLEVALERIGAYLS